jgi:two-component system chemotaxis response regulator CheB
MMTPVLAANPDRKSVRVFIAESSPLLVRALTTALANATEVEVIGHALDGDVAIEQVKSLRPDVLLLSLDVPKQNGYEVLAAIMARHPVATIVLVPSHVNSNEVSRKLAAMGAVESITKPRSADLVTEAEKLRATLAPLVRRAGKMKVVRMLASPTSSVRPDSPTGARDRVLHPADVTPSLRSLREIETPTRATQRVVLIGSSTGGPEILRRVLRALPHPLPFPIIIAQHIPKGFSRDLATTLQMESGGVVVEAAAGESARLGAIYVGAGGMHTRVREGGVFATMMPVTPDENTPSVNMLFKTGAAVWGAGVLAIVLTGMGEDGAQGVKAVKAAGGQVIVQDEATSRIFGMPAAALETGCVDAVSNPEEIRAQILRFASVQVT